MTRRIMLLVALVAGAIAASGPQAAAADSFGSRITLKLSNADAAWTGRVTSRKSECQPSRRVTLLRNGAQLANTATDATGRWRVATAIPPSPANYAASVAARTIAAGTCRADLSPTVDLAPPETTLVSAPPAKTFDPAPSFRFTANVAGSRFDCRMDGAAFAPCTSPQAYSGLADGSHTFRVRAVDAAGNADATPATATFAVDTSVPNILLVITDDQRIGTMDQMPRTSAFFGGGGTTYTHGYVTTPLCCPSRSSIFSGKYAHNHGVVVNDGSGFDPTQSWQRYLHDAGYYTGIVGKYLNGVPIDTAPYFDYRENVENDDPEEPRLLASLTDQFLTGAEANDRRPWALVYATHSPHDPLTVQPVDPRPIPAYDPPPSYMESDLSDKYPPVAAMAGRNPNRLASVRDGQLLELQATDESLGDVYADLTRLGEEHNTLAIFLSDNGYLWGEHALWAKLWPYTESIQVPFYARWPDHIAAGAVSDSLVANIDIAPTIMDAAGITPGYAVDGQPLFGTAPRSWLLAEWPTAAPGGPPPWSSYVSADRQYVEWDDGSGFVEDYDLTGTLLDPGDPFEMRASNQVDPAIASQLAAARTCAGAACP
jgi:hypothetical protein